MEVTRLKRPYGSKWSIACTDNAYIQRESVCAVRLSTNVLRLQSWGCCVWNFWLKSVRSACFRLQTGPRVCQAVRTGHKWEGREFRCPFPILWVLTHFSSMLLCTFIQQSEQSENKHDHNYQPEHKMGVTGGEREKKKWQKLDLSFWGVDDCRKEISLIVMR